MVRITSEFRDFILKQEKSYYEKMTNEEMYELMETFNVSRQGILKTKINIKTNTDYITYSPSMIGKILKRSNISLDVRLMFMKLDSGLCIKALELKEEDDGLKNCYRLIIDYNGNLFYQRYDKMINIRQEILNFEIDNSKWDKMDKYSSYIEVIVPSEPILIQPDALLIKRKRDDETITQPKKVHKPKVKKVQTIDDIIKTQYHRLIKSIHKNVNENNKDNAIIKEILNLSEYDPKMCYIFKNHTVFFIKYFDRGTNYFCIFYLDSNNIVTFSDILKFAVSSQSIPSKYILIEYFLEQIKNKIDKCYKKHKDIDISIKYNKRIDKYMFQDTFLEGHIVIYPVNHLRNDVNVPIICTLKK